MPIVAMALLNACATLVHGASQQVGIASAPAGARVTIDSLPAGVTPLVTRLSRSRAHRVRIEQDGYQPFDARVRRTMSFWALPDWCAVMLVVPLVVDVGTGGMFNLSPDLISVELKPVSPPAPPAR